MNDDVWPKGVKKGYVEYECKFITATRKETKSKSYHTLLALYGH